LAEEVNLSKSYVSHVFKEITGLTLMEFVMAWQAKYRLEMEPYQPLSEISSQVDTHFTNFLNCRKKFLEIFTKRDTINTNLPY
jgi:AraC family transcriptional regulator, melibiose operon regulatory protein